MATPYRIADDPVPSRLERFALNPLWPMLSFMLAGAWIAWPWFALNGFALGSPTRRRELGLAIFGFVGSAVILIAIVGLTQADIIVGRRNFRLALLLLSAFKIALCYGLFTLQTRPFQIFEHYSSGVRSGAMPLILAFLFGPRLLGLLPELPAFRLLQVLLR